MRGRKGNVITHNVPEPTTDYMKREEEEKIREIFAIMKCDEIVPKSVVKLGRPVNGRTQNQW